MSKSIVLSRDANTSIPWQKFSKFLDIHEFQQDREGCLADTAVAVIDHADRELRQDAALAIRRERADIPILLVCGVGDNSIEEFLNQTPGHGQIRAFTHYPGHSDRILSAIHELEASARGMGGAEYAFVLPAYNEESRFNHVRDFLNQLNTLISRSFPRSSIYIIDDGSSDGTSDCAQSFAQKLQNSSTSARHCSFLSVNQLKKNTRKAGTWIHALDQIDADYLIFCDADNSFHINDISRMLNTLLLGYWDIVAGTKDFTAEKRTLTRKLLSAAKRFLTRRLLPPGVYDSQTGLKTLNRTALRTIAGRLHAENELAIDLELLYVAKKSQLRVLQMPVNCIDREGSHINPLTDAMRFIPSLFRIPRLTKSI